MRRNVLPGFISSRRLWSLLNFLFWAGLLISPLIRLAFGVVTGGNPLLILGLIFMLVVASISMNRLIGVSEVKKTGSTYGVESKKDT